MNVRKWFDFFILGWHRLETIPMLPLGSSLKDAISLCGDPLQSLSSDDSAEITEHTFSAGKYHQVLALEYQNAIQSVTYWSESADPARDLNYVLAKYRGESGWRLVEKGHWYWREDDVVRLWCSAAPAIGVATADFLTTKTKLKRAEALKRIDEASEVTWADNNAVFELQRLFVEDNDSPLFDLAKRSDKIAVSPDGRDVFIVRNHHAYDVDDGFVELNEPPPAGAGSTQVVNSFHWSKDGESWSKITLPRNAEVRLLRFDGDQCSLEITQATTGQSLSFRGPASYIRGLNAVTITVGPHDDLELWKRLENESLGQPS